MEFRKIKSAHGGDSALVLLAMILGEKKKGGCFSRNTLVQQGRRIDRGVFAYGEAERNNESRGRGREALVAVYSRNDSLYYRKKSKRVRPAWLWTKTLAISPHEKDYCRYLDLLGEGRTNRNQSAAQVGDWLARETGRTTNDLRCTSGRKHGEISRKNKEERRGPTIRRVGLPTIGRRKAERYHRAENRNLWREAARLLGGLKTGFKHFSDGGPLEMGAQTSFKRLSRKKGGEARVPRTTYIRRMR